MAPLAASVSLASVTGWQFDFRRLKNSPFLVAVLSSGERVVSRCVGDVTGSFVRARRGAGASSKREEQRGGDDGDLKVLHDSALVIWSKNG